MTPSMPARSPPGRLFQAGTPAYRVYLGPEEFAGPGVPRDAGAIRAALDAAT